jgi:hypothetical protein
MTLPELKALLDQTGHPVYYSHWKPTQDEPNPPDPPFICYLETFSSNFSADNSVFKKIPNVQVELYTKKKNLAAEADLEAILDSNEIPYDTSELFIESEQLFQKIYEVTLT